jgi:hypothetical protein
LPSRGARVRADVEVATGLWGSDYRYAKTTIAYDHYLELPWHHVLVSRLIGGFTLGAPPLYERFFVGDLDPLLPPRALGLNFSTQPPFALLGLDAIRDVRYAEIGGRAALEYVVPLWRNHRFFYAGDFFGMAGLFTLTNWDALEVRSQPLSNAVPLDLTFDVGIRADTYIGIFTFSVANAIGRLPL